jgi:CO/xanthine dehydrogenase FAD-binding subunit
VERAAIVLGAVASRPLPAGEAEAFLVGRRPTPETLAEAARLARKPATPFDNTDFQAQWRSAMVVPYTEAALREAAGLPVERLPPNHAF